MCRYSAAPSISSGLVPSRWSTPRVPARPIPHSAMPISSESSAAVATVCRVPSASRAPIWRAVTTLMPLPSPIRKPVNRLTSVVVEPTAPSATEPEKRPTTAISDILNSTCSRLEAISGRLNSRICLYREPLVRSCSRVAASIGNGLLGEGFLRRGAVFPIILLWPKKSRAIPHTCVRYCPFASYCGK